MLQSQKTAVKEIETTEAETRTSEDKTDSEWIKVVPIPKNMRMPEWSSNKINPAQPDAIVIQKHGETSHPEILKKIKSGQKFHILGQNVKNIRKTAKG